MAQLFWKAKNSENLSRASLSIGGKYAVDCDCSGRVDNYQMAGQNISSGSSSAIYCLCDHGVSNTGYLGQLF